MHEKSLREKALSGLGGLIGIAIFAGLFFFQCVYPVLRDESVTGTCASEELADFCEDPDTLAGFMALMCGRDRVEFVGSPMRLLNPEPGQSTLIGVSFTIKCEGLSARWETEEGEGTPEGFEDLKRAASNDDAEAVMEVLEQWHLGELSTREAQLVLLGTDALP
jgi:hypothetical protein